MLSPTATWSRREVVSTLAAGCIATLFRRPAQQNNLLSRPIPSSGEMIPAVGLGTWQTFDVGESPNARAPLREVLRLFAEHGGGVVDSSPMYRRAEEVVGDLAADLNIASTLFHATKVWTRGRDAGITQMERSMQRMRVETMDLMQIHNLLDWRTHLNTLRAWKEEEQGRVRYIGITHYTVRSQDDLESIIRSEPIDFVQTNYSIATRSAQRRLLPTAADRGVAVVINRPYESGALFRAVRGHQPPVWAREFGAQSWGQFFLKYILSHPDITCVIPATSDPEHLVDNMGAGTGELPDAAMRARMVQHLERL